MADKKETSKKEKKGKVVEEVVPESESTSNESSEESPTTEEKTPTAEEVNALPEQPVETVEDLKAQMKNGNDRYLRLMAEFDNYKKRSSREYQAMVDSANERLMTDLVDVRENFERAIKNGEQSTDYKTLFDGLKLIFSKFDAVLSKYGLEVFAVTGDEFDPQVHDALMKAPHPEIPEDHIADIYERGYLLKGKVMKHARVIVSSGKPEGGAGDDGLKK